MFLHKIKAAPEGAAQSSPQPTYQTKTLTNILNRVPNVFLRLLRREGRNLLRPSRNGQAEVCPLASICRIASASVSGFHPCHFADTQIESEVVAGRK